MAKKIINRHQFFSLSTAARHAKTNDVLDLTLIERGKQAIARSVGITPQLVQEIWKINGIDGRMTVEQKNKVLEGYDLGEEEAYDLATEKRFDEDEPKPKAKPRPKPKAKPRPVVENDWTRGPKPKAKPRPKPRFPGIDYDPHVHVRPQAEEPARTFEQPTNEAPEMRFTPTPEGQWQACDEHGRPKERADTAATLFKIIREGLEEKIKAEGATAPGFVASPALQAIFKGFCLAQAAGGSAHMKIDMVDGNIESITVIGLNVEEDEPDSNEVALAA